MILGSIFVLLPSVSLDKDSHWTAHPPKTLLLVIIGIAMLLISVAGYLWSLLSKRTEDLDRLDLSRVEEADGFLQVKVSGCEIRVTDGRVEEYTQEIGSAMILPCNEYFDDRCAVDTNSALGAYVNRIFAGQADAFMSLVNIETRKKLGPGRLEQKTDQLQAESFGAGKCVLITQPLGRPNPIALVSTTTQRAGRGLSAQISCLFEGMRELVKSLADERIAEVVMPVLGGGHGQIHPPLAFIGLLLAIAEAARYGQGGQRLKKVTIVVFKKDKHTPAVVDRTVERRALALLASQN